MGTTLRRLRKLVQKVAKKAGLSLAETKLATDVVRGISTRGSCHLSEIGRALGEPCELIETERRLSEGLSDPESSLDAMRIAWVREVAGAAAKMPFITCDMTDIVKPYGKAFENLDTVRDASDRRKHLEPGYMSVQIEATDETHRNLPLWSETFSTQADDYAGWWETVERGLLQVVARVGQTATWLFDRGFDALEFLRVLQFVGIVWVVRQMQVRQVVLADGEVVGTRQLASELRKPYATALPYVDKKTHRMRAYPVSFGYAPVRLLDLEGRFWLIVITGVRDQDIVLLTNARIDHWHDAERMVLAYVRRWGVEEGTRFWKQSTNVEDFRVRNYDSIRRLTFLSMLAYGIQALWLLRRPSLARKLIARVKVFIELVPFLQYRLWAGVADALLSRA